MVRRLRFCASCHKKFISKASTHLECGQCIGKRQASTSAATTVTSTPRAAPIPQCQPLSVKPLGISSCNTYEGCGFLQTAKRARNDAGTAATAATTTPLPIDTSSRQNDHGEDLSLKNSANSVPKIVGAASAEVTPHMTAKKDTSHQDLVNICDDSSATSEKSGVSEGLDEFHCTQLWDDDNDDASHAFDNDAASQWSNNNDSGEIAQHDPGENANKEIIHLNEALLPPTSDARCLAVTTKTKESPPAATISAKNANESDEICFICGSSFDRITSGLTGRLQHIKRCAKKYGVTARDVRINDDDDAFTTTNASTDDAPRKMPPPCNAENDDNNKKPAAITNPYATKNMQRANLKWHGDAEEDLKYASATSAPTPTYGQTSGTVVPPLQGGETKQKALKQFFTAPLRSLNNVLVANAKRVAKTADILNAPGKLLSNKQTGGQQGGKGKRRRWIGAKRDPRKCPAFKRIPQTNFIVDGFTYASKSLTKNYFLTHFHSDHYGGISRDWSAGTIYCSLPTANLVHNQLGVDRVFLHPLGLNTPVVIESDGRPVTVTLFDANHCPGAIMFLFQVGKRSILHVGDFRWHKEKMLSNPPLKALSMKDPQQLDDLFLDTTYCNERYTLPTQEAAIKAAIEYAVREVEEAKRKKERLLMLFGAYTIGKERIYLSVAERLGVKIYVNSQRLKVLSALEWPEERMDMLTTKKDESNLWVVELGHINMKRMPPYLFNLSQAKSPIQKFDRVVGFRPTGWSHRAGNSLISTARKGQLVVHSVPYSEHSAFPELLDCIRTLKPKKITPTVTVAKSQEQVDLLLRHVNIRQRTLLEK